MRKSLSRAGYLAAATVVTTLWFPILVALFTLLIAARALYEIKRRASRIAR